MGCAALAEVAGRVDGARVVSAGGLVVLGRFCAGLGLIALLETVALVGSSGAVFDHLLDHAGGAWSCLAAVLVAGALASVALHETSVQNTVVRGLDTNAALAFLHNNCKDESSVDASFAGHPLDVSVNVVCFVVRVVARCGNENLVEIPAEKYV